MSDTPAWKQRLEELEQYVENLSKTKPPAWAVERAKEIAESIFAEWQASCARHPEGYPSPMGLIVERHIAAALTIPDGHVRLPSGEVVKTIGTPLFTADRCIAFPGAVVWTPDGSDYNVAKYPTQPGRPVIIFKDGSWQVTSYMPVAVEMCFSSKETAVASLAAESARSGGGA